MTTPTGDTHNEDDFRLKDKNIPKLIPKSIIYLNCPKEVYSYQISNKTKKYEPVPDFKCPKCFNDRGHYDIIKDDGHDFDIMVCDDPKCGWWGGV